MNKMFLAIFSVLVLSMMSAAVMASVCVTSCSPDVDNSIQCAQTPLFECVPGAGDHKSKVRDAFGECNNGCCKEDNFGGAECVVNQCGAVCKVDADCDDGKINTDDSCMGNCVCEHVDNQIPEFGTIAALVALAGAVTAFLVIRK